jgi:NAD(P)-dependent dehydrogenase (short-subunit alcohol dehydrogenase family)
VQLPGTIAVVTGAAVRLGRAIALSLADAGCDVCLHYRRSRDAADETADEIRALGVRAVTVHADLSSPRAAAETIFTAAEQLGPVSILINSAAIFGSGTLLTTTDDDWDRHFAVNLAAPFHLCREFARQHAVGLEATRTPPASGSAGHIINIADWRALRPDTNHLAYTLTKSALVTLTKILAVELAPEIQVNAVAPGAILPAIGSDPAQDGAAAAHPSRAAAFDRLAAGIPLGRTGEPHDVAGAVLYLLRSNFVTGELLHVTGGEELTR